MSIVASDIKVYGSAVMPDDDTTTAIGGAIDLTTKIEFTDIASSGKLNLVSSNAGDTMNMTVYGRNASGELINEIVALSGTTPVQTTLDYERILKLSIASTAAGTITVTAYTGGASIMTLEPGILQARKPFYNAATPASSSVSFYEKVFFKNTNGTLSLTSAQIIKQTDATGKITFALETTLDGTGTNGANNRQVAPSSGVGSFDVNTKNVANSQNHSSGKGQGVWLCLTLASTDVATKTTVTMRETGIST